MFLNTERYKSEESTGEKLARENLKKELEKVSSSEEDGEKHVEETRSKSSLKRVASMARIFLTGKYKDSSSNRQCGIQGERKMGEGEQGEGVSWARIPRLLSVHARARKHARMRARTQPRKRIRTPVFQGFPIL